MAQETPHKALLDRRQPVSDVDEHFRDAVNLLRDITNYGTNLIIRCFATGDRKLEDAVILGALLRQAVAMFDALEILVANAAVHPSQLQQRAIFEASLYIDFMLRDDTEAKAKSYYVANLREQRAWACKAQPGSPENTAFAKTTDAFGLSDFASNDDIRDQAAGQIEEIDRILAQEELAQANAALQQVKDSKSLPYEPAWYIPFGQRSIRQIAISVERLHEYELIYSGSSEVMHATKYTHHFKFVDGNIHFEPIRYLESISTVVNLSVGQMIHIYRTILNHYRPEEMSAFKRKYTEDWRGPFFDVKRVRYSRGENSIVI